MSIWNGIIAFFDERSGCAEFRQAQYAELSRQIPLMYGIVVINMVVLAATYVGKAPAILSVWLPGIFVVVCVFRAIKMILARDSTPPDEIIARKLRVIVVLACVLGVLISIWSLLLFAYGDAYTKGLNVFFAGITIITVMTCLRPLRQVAPALFILVVVPTGLFLALQEHEVFSAIALNMALVIGGMVAVLQRSHSDFRERIEKQIKLDSQHRQLQTLHEAISVMANEDSLTGLANRRSFFEHLDQRIKNYEHDLEPFAVGVVDLDGFKPVNDIFGHSVGDRLLKEVSHRLSSRLPANALLSRLGGDEFALILPQPASKVELLHTCQNALASLEAPFLFDEGSITISATCGLACFPGAATTAIDIYEKADFALYHSKQNDRGRLTIFSEAHADVIRKSAAVAQRLRTVQADEAFHLEYQPIVDRDGYLIGFEALARWHDPVLGQVSPDVFIRAAEQAGIIGTITISLFSKALLFARSWPSGIALSFNLSAFDICSQNTIAAVLEQIETAGIAPDRLMVEITESAIMHDFGRATQALEALRERSVRVALDDFGTGYSSLSYLRRLPIDRIKIDRSFILGIEHDKAARDIIETIGYLCESLGLECIVEGVETHAQQQILSSTRVTGYQGYLYSRPMPKEAVANYLIKQEQR